jgi:urease accessory protein
MSGYQSMDKPCARLHPNRMDLTGNAYTPATRPQRAVGAGRLRVHRDSVSRLETLFQEGSARVRFPTSPDEALEAVLINTAGGLTGGDRFSWAVDVGADARCRVITQACEKIYRSTGDAARIDVKLTVAAGASLEWLPQETILFEGSNLRRDYDVRIEPGGRMLAVEAVILGRAAMGETEIQARLRDRWRVQWGKRLIFADDLRLDDLLLVADRSALLHGAKAFASVLLIADNAEVCLDAVRLALGETGGASAFDGKLFCRILAADGLALRKILVPVMAALRGGAPTPRLWTV